MGYHTLADTVGNTPLVQIQRLYQDTRGNVILGKLEGNNPAGSVKDRPAFNMILQAEKRGEIRPGDTLIEATSGNTGIALAMVAAMRGYKIKLIMPDNMTQERMPATLPEASQAPVRRKVSCIVPSTNINKRSFIYQEGIFDG